MKEWLISVTVLILITSIVSYIIPNGQIGDFIKGIFSFVVILAMLKPMMALTELSNFNFQKEVSVQTQYIDYTSQKIVEEYEWKCKQIVSNALCDCTVLIDYEINDEYQIEILSAKILLDNPGIILQPEHINITEEIISEISNFLMINKEQVIINGK